tara:strand:+ start:505 stop:1662 length:1158 start_codon:yes stop_codon:yes gene_type:complete
MQASKIVMKAKGKTGTIDIYGTIGQNFWGEGVSVKEFKKDLADLGDVDLLEVRIHSYGGFVQEGMAMITALSRHKAEKHIFVDGIAASMASVILATGDKRYIAKNATIMIHNPFTFCMGEEADMTHCAADLKKTKGQILDIYEEGSTLSREELSQKMDESTRFTAEEALEAGLVDEIGVEVTEDEDDAKNHENYFNFGIAAHADMPKIAPFLNLEAFNQTSGDPENHEENDMDKPKTPASNGEQNDNQIDATQAAADQTAAVQAASTSATTAETERVQGILDLSQPGVEDLCKQLAFDGETTVEQAGLQVANKLKELGSSNLDNKRQNANAPVAGEHGKGEQPENSDSLDDAWTNNVGNCQDEFLDIEDFKAFKKADTENRVKIL